MVAEYKQHGDTPMIMQQVMADGTILYPASNDVWKARMEVHENDLEVTREYINNFDGVQELQRELEEVRLEHASYASKGADALQEKFRREADDEVRALQKDLRGILCSVIIVGWSCVGVPVLSAMLLQ
jgi:hypothetical protein